MKNISNKIGIVLLILIFGQFLFKEVPFLLKDIILNRGQTTPKIEHLRPIDDPSYSLTFKVDQLSSIDTSKSYIQLSGSKNMFDRDPNAYSYLLDKREAFLKVNLDDTSKVTLDLNENTITIVDDHKPSTDYAIETEIYLYDLEGKLTYLWQITPFHINLFTYISLRTSYLLQNLVWFFAIFGFFSLRKNLSIVYDSRTKKPISGAIARIYNEGRLTQTFITNVLGFINLRVPEGKYRLEIIKPGYIFPSKLNPLSHDGNYQNLYYGKEIIIKKNNSRFDFNFPLDPVDYQVKVSAITTITTAALNTVNNSNTFALFFVSIAQIIIWPKIFDTWAFATIAGLILIAKLVISKSGSTKLGRVVDRSNKPVSNVKLQVYDTQWNRPVTTFESNENGEFELLLMPNQYYIKIINPDLKLVKADAEDKQLLVGKQIGETVYINDIIKVEPRV